MHGQRQRIHTTIKQQPRTADTVHGGHGSGGNNGPINGAGKRRRRMVELYSEPYSHRAGPFSKSRVRREANDGEPTNHPRPKTIRQRRNEEREDDCGASTRACHAEGSKDRLVVASVHTLAGVDRLAHKVC